MRRNSVLKLFLCKLRKRIKYGDWCYRWRLLYEDKENHFIIYECEDCGAIDLIDYQKEMEDDVD